ncbi:hypothetical protein TNCV_723421 [Trichonephila clavipes]|nr:hypothetical protein TNCV_723421 [Trichonephila clavipes]
MGCFLGISRVLGSHGPREDIPPLTSDQSEKVIVFRKRILSRIQRLWNSLINPPKAHLFSSSKSVFCSKSLTRSSEKRSWVSLFRSTQVTGAQAAITSPSWIVLVLSLMLAILTRITEFERSTTDEAISTLASKLAESG